ncbi:hypothetical protein OIO90_002774 [Microbotryomycetes sp. JL221]|nr:hypothetical protein OIO90_002774 [Microbotryomycetes sp. JL221]
MSSSGASRALFQAVNGNSEASTSASSLTPALFKRLHPGPFLQKFLDSNVRPDGRPAGHAAGQSAYRDVSINTGSISTAPSSALVRFGKTTLVCGITLETAPPDITTPHAGFIVPNVDLSPLCSGKFRPGPPSDEAQALTTRLRDILIASNVLPLSALVIEPGKAAFVVYLDVVCLNYDGGVLDAAVLACSAALKNLKLPKATWDPDKQTTGCNVDETGTAVPVSHVPVSVSFGAVNGHLLPDPTQFETTLCSSQITVTLSLPLSSTTSRRRVDNRAKLVAISQLGAAISRGSTTQTDGGTTVAGADQLKACISLARTRAQTLLEIMQQ